MPLLPEEFRRKCENAGLIQIPALIDPHVHFRVPGGEQKEDWKTGSIAAIRGGVTTVFDMPNNHPPCTTVARVLEKKKIIDTQLQEANIPLRYGLYFGADKDNLDEIEEAAKHCAALKIFMGCSTGGLVIDTDEALDEAFQRAAAADMLVAVHAEDEHILSAKRKEFAGAVNPADHSLMRPREAAIRATEKAINLASKYRNSLYILHMSTQEEVELVRQAKKDGLSVYAEATTHHLFFTIEDYARLKTFIQMNPPVRTKDDQQALWEGICDGTIDTIGTDHAPHTIAEKQLPFGKAPSGIPGVQTLLPLMLDAVNKKKLSIERLIELTRLNIEKIFRLRSNSDTVWINMNLEQKVSHKEMASKCGWTPYDGMLLKGWPIYTVIENRVFNLGTAGEKLPREVGQPSIRDSELAGLK